MSKKLYPNNGMKIDGLYRVVLTNFDVLMYLFVGGFFYRSFANTGNHPKTLDVREHDQT